MSVPEGERRKGRLEVHTKAQFLASHTAKLLSNRKIFDPSVDPVIINRIKNCAYDIYSKAWAANQIHAEVSDFNHAWRFGLQQEAILLCDEMLAYIGIAKQGNSWKLIQRMKEFYRLLWEVSDDQSSEGQNGTAAQGV